MHDDVSIDFDDTALAVAVCTIAVDRHPWARRREMVRHREVARVDLIIRRLGLNTEIARLHAHDALLSRERTRERGRQEEERYRKGGDDAASQAVNLSRASAPSRSISGGSQVKSMTLDSRR